MAKKHKRAKQRLMQGMGQGMAGYSQDQGMGYGMGFGAPQAQAAGFGAPGGLPPLDSGFMQQLPAFLRSRNAEQFLIGALVGAAATWVLSDEQLRGRIVKSAIKLYAGVAGGFEEMKEQMADLKAEVEAERHGDA